MTMLHFKKSIDRSLSWRCGFVLIPLALVCFALLPRAQAVVPAPDGGYPGQNTAEGQDALFNLTNGSFNTAIGGHALFENTTGGGNTAIGAFSLAANIDGINNVAIGQGALGANTSSGNTATGFKALSSNTDGSGNTATGFQALFGNTGGIRNTANGAGALQANTAGGDNTAIGFQALFHNTGLGNTASGTFALWSNTTGERNIAIGDSALSSNTRGQHNTVVGEQALLNNKTGNGNTAIGAGTLVFSFGDNNTALGNSAGNNVQRANNVIAIGSSGADVSNTTWIGNVYGVTTQNAMTAPVVVSADGQFGTVASSERFKKDIATMEKASEAILSLRPVTFHYKTDSKGTPQFGLIAEEVAKVNSALVLPDKEGKPFTVRYDAVNAMLLNEFLKEHSTVQEQGAVIAELRRGMEVLAATVKEQASQIQKVSAQLEASKPVPQVVNNP